jgi:hypothetical protein
VGLGISAPQPRLPARLPGFIAIWRALEADYGAPPHRDFSRWKLDPRAYGPLPGAAPTASTKPTGELCVVDDERVLLECWMGEMGLSQISARPGALHAADARRAELATAAPQLRW